jgi:hypothetical protein
MLLYLLGHSPPLFKERAYPDDLKSKGIFALTRLPLVLLYFAVASAVGCILEIIFFLAIRPIAAYEKESPYPNHKGRSI